MGVIEIADPILRTVDARYYLKEYDEILLGKRKTYSASCMNKALGPKISAELLRYIFKYYLRWRPEQVRDCLTPEVVKTMRLEALINRIPSPPEVKRSTELYFVAWYIYPETVNVSKSELIIKVYMDVINGTISKFPKGYFDGNDGYLRARLLLLIMIREFLTFDSLESLYAFFAGENGRKAIAQYKLTVPLRELYTHPLDYLHDALSEDQKSEELYTKYRHGNKKKEAAMPIATGSDREADHQPHDEYECQLREELNSVEILSSMGYDAKEGDDAGK